MNLKTKLIALFLLLSIVPLTLVGYLAYRNSREAIEQNILNHLISVNMLKAGEFNRWIDGNKQQLRELARRPLVIEYATALKPQRSVNSDHQVVVRHRLLEDHLLPSVKETSDFQSLSILNGQSGVVIVSTAPQLEGVDFGSSPPFIRGKQQTYVDKVQYSERQQQIEIQISTPVVDEAGNLTAVLVGQVAPAEMVDIMGQGNGEYATEITHFFNEFSFFVTRPGLGPEAVLTEAVVTEGSSDCLMHQNGTGFYQDYRNVPVIGAYQWIPERELCIVTEMAQEAAFAPIDQLQQVMAAVGGGVSVIVSLLGLFFARTITRPVQQLVRGVQEVGQGNLDYRIEIDSGDEIGQLAAAFNHMAVQRKQSEHALQHARDELEQRVEERTQMLQAKEEQFRTLIQHSADIITIVDADGIIQFESPSVEKVLGYTPEALIGQDIFTLIHPDDVLEMTYLFNQLVQSPGAVISTEARSLHKDGSVRILEVTAVNLLTNQDIKGSVVNSRDITKRKQAETSHRLQGQILTNMAEGVTLVRASDATIVYANPKFEEMFGYEPGTLLGQPAHIVDAPGDRSPEGTAAEVIINVNQDGYWQGKVHKIKKDGTPFLCQATVSTFDHFDHGLVWIAIYTDITENDQVRKELVEKTGAIQLLQEVAIAANESKGIDETLQYVVDLICSYTGWPVGHVYRPAQDGSGEIVPTAIWHLENLERFTVFRERTMVTSIKLGHGLLGRVFRESEPAWVTNVTEDPQFIRAEAAKEAGLESGFAFPVLSGVEVTAVMEFFATKVMPPDKLLLEVIEQIGTQLGRVIERRQAEETLREKEQKLLKAQQIAHLGNWETELATGKSRWSDEFFRICGIEPGAVEPTAELGFQLIHPDDRDIAAKAVADALEQDKEYWIEKRIVRPNGEVRYVLSQGEVERNENGQPVTLVGTFLDITQQKLAEQAVAQKNEELARSNAELEQFAYVASHDLREPLRSISGYLQLLERRYRGQLGADADKFITRSVAATERMQKLIEGLLAYSRVGTRGQPFEPTDCKVVLDQTIANLTKSIEETGARIITTDKLPTVVADSGQLSQLFQNLVGNAIKFHGDQPPRIDINAEQCNGDWLFSVKDNGIGMEPKYIDRIFLVFQRLHSRSIYSGTGIGLAICKKIVERHQGRIWVETELGQGSTFYFTIPERKGFNGKGENEQTISSVDDR